MKKKYSNLTELIKNELSRKENFNTKKLIGELKIVKKRGHFTRDEFLKMCKWKSPRPERYFKSNSSELIKDISKKVISTKYEKRKIDLLTKLKGVSVPTASAILTLLDPQNYGVIDIRVWQLLYLYGSVKKKPRGQGFNFNDWFYYLLKLRYFAKKFHCSVRNIEYSLFQYHRKIQEGNLYN